DVSPGTAQAAWGTPMRLTTASGLKQAPSLYVDRDGTMNLVYQKVDRPDTGITPLTLPSTFTDKAIDLNATSDVGTSIATTLPELGFSRPLTFPGHDVAASAGMPLHYTGTSGMPLAGDAQIINRGLAGTHVRVDYFDGGEVPFASETIYLAPGHTFDTDKAFPL